MDQSLSHPAIAYLSQHKDRWIAVELRNGVIDEVMWDSDERDPTSVIVSRSGGAWTEKGRYAIDRIHPFDIVALA